MWFIVVLELISVYCMRDWFSFLSVSFMLILTAIILQFDSNFVIILMGNNWLVWLKVIEWYLWWFWLVGWSKKWRKQDVFVNEEEYDFDLIRELMEGRHWQWVVFFVEIIYLIDNLRWYFYLIRWRFYWEEVFHNLAIWMRFIYFKV